MRVQACREAAGRIGRAPGRVALTGGRPDDVRRVEEDGVETLTGHRSEQVAVTALDAFGQPVERGVAGRAFDGGAIDVDGHDAARMAGGEYRADAGSRAEIEHLATCAEAMRRDHLREEGAGAQYARIENRGKDHQRRAGHALEPLAIVTGAAREPVEYGPGAAQR